MKPLLLILSLTTLLSCRKNIEDHIVGTWQLTDAYRTGFLSRDRFTTGYEDGRFIFYENGNASFVSTTDTLYGTWETDFYSVHYGESSQTYKSLDIYVVNYRTNKTINLDLDDFHFRDSKDRIVGEHFLSSNKKVYEFTRR